MNSNLFDSFQLGSNNLDNRVVMAPMTRLRADGTIPTQLMAEYYAQRATAGLIITECTMISPLSQGYMNVPGIYNEEQIQGWKLVTNAVHAQGGKIFLQIWHSGRVAHSALLNGEKPVAPSAIAATGQLHTPIGKVEIETPHALETSEISEIIAQFRQATVNAKQAGFDGVELHGAFGYLIDQFLQDGSNQRQDKYGGSIENRARFLLEVVEAVTQVWRGDCIGIKLSPSNTFYGMVDSDPQATFSYVIKALNNFNLAYIHLMEANEVDLKTRQVIDPVLPIFRPLYQGNIITNGGYNKETGNSAIASGNAELVSYGRPYLANPDLVKRFVANAPLNEPDPRTFYGRGDTENAKVGYTDYSFL
ncbi:alkene reductase [Pleurocapsa sp. CCALA 161]|uniref:alkene reductase n=1 Tax=Pleurocapsa sp. CCALA 161 TaxID=2107688 RepID=UPI000D07C333|nr:alkene reductase [Pleurocapsa sp. CCALA 161]PSB12526.1 alkene reductase [Pleurocapsa sp. CCALA 161]